MKALPLRLELPRTVRVVYDPKTGAIVHTHHVVVLPNAKAPTDKQLDADAISLAGKISKHPTDSLKVLTLKSDDFHDGVNYAVNVATGRLEEVRKASKKSSRSSKR
jgi:hypothetical protein